MHTSLDASIGAFLSLEKSFRKARKAFGDHVAIGELRPVHGRQTNPDASGHFDLHEYASVDLLSEFAVVQQIPEGDSHG